MIGITFALPSESSGLVRRLQQVQKRDNLISGKIDNRDVTILNTGVGAKNCNARLEVLLHKMRPRLVISSGFAGAVADELSVGNLILAENFSDPKLLATAAQILSVENSHRVKLFTSTSIVDSVAERNEIARASGAAAVDMETGAVAAVCHQPGFPLLPLRAISDSAREPFPMPPSVLFDIERQRASYCRLISYLLRHPGSISGMVRFARQTSTTRDVLTDAIVELILAL